MNSAITKPTVNIFWFRRDLRLQDNAGLWYALRSGQAVLPVFIFDRNILDDLEDKSDRRLTFIHGALEKMQAELLQLGSSMEVCHGFPEEVFSSLLAKYHVVRVFCNHDYEPYAAQRDLAVSRLLAAQGVGWESHKDQVLYEKDEVLKSDGSPYTVFTPYSRKWKGRLQEESIKSFELRDVTGHFYRQPALPIPTLESLGFRSQTIAFSLPSWEPSVIRSYGQNRDFPGLKGTSRLSVHLRFGTVSIRQLVSQTRSLSEEFLNELIWRDFYHMILWQFPRVGQGRAFKPDYELIPWRNNEAEFLRWCTGTTGYPIVDAGMRELNATGFMHNRVRMIVASFLTKHLLIDWRWGEAYFASRLLDFDLAANNGGWQWAAGSGCDAAPYFRVFNPTLQTERFDPELKYIRTWVPELMQKDYPAPVVEHDFARKRALAAYASVLKK